PWPPQGRLRSTARAIAPEASLRSRREPRSCRGPRACSRWTGETGSVASRNSFFGSSRNSRCWNGLHVDRNVGHVGHLGAEEPERTLRELSEGIARLNVVLGKCNMKRLLRLQFDARGGRGCSGPGRIM